VAALTIAAEGGKADIAKPMHQDAQARDRPDKGPFEETAGDVAMKGEKLEVVRGGGNVFRDLGHKKRGLGSRVEVKVRVSRAETAAHEARRF
jgi:hypothetical protein